jgi:hypothetical protein
MYRENHAIYDVGEQEGSVIVPFWMNRSPPRPAPAPIPLRNPCPAHGVLPILAKSSGLMSDSTCWTLVLPGGGGAAALDGWVWSIGLEYSIRSLLGPTGPLWSLGAMVVAIE